ncbi:hypothetical protein AU161_gp18 [Pseudomonas phage PPPL-1]|uniref:Uncharacterized protein n=1 Tax=Pseudomonas phage PPPL-1 TaxID=1755692 RepID=A0A0S2MVM5_9CAUD|nr:hypothetical protein AU161_gp18 [Pseudomonas phage PPPL-1]ALO79978.1 hypothetical protein PPPL1_018 [Pseudomonas phage PPPL-1]
MNRAQGNTRSMPDGFLHIQNFTVTKAAGMAAVVYTHLLTDEGRDVVQNLLMERARVIEEREDIFLFHEKHGTYRFRKDFLKENFREVVHATTKITRQPVIENFKEFLIRERESLTY